MTTYKSKTSDQTATIEACHSTLGPVVHMLVRNDEDPVASIYLDPADAPAIALSVLEAGGMANECSGMSKAQEHAWDAANSLRSAVRFTAAAAEEAARGKRRDELAREISQDVCGAYIPELDYDSSTTLVRAAIDRIIDIENELAKERAK